MVLSLYPTQFRPGSGQMHAERGWRHSDDLRSLVRRQIAIVGENYGPALTVGQVVQSSQYIVGELAPRWRRIGTRSKQGGKLGEEADPAERATAQVSRDAQGEQDREVPFADSVPLKPGAQEGLLGDVS